MKIEEIVIVGLIILVGTLLITLIEVVNDKNRKIKRLSEICKSLLKIK